jgi:hypothetical protein
VRSMRLVPTRRPPDNPQIKKPNLNATEISILSASQQAFNPIVELEMLDQGEIALVRLVARPLSERVRRSSR